MTFKENINRICAERGTNLTAVITKVKGSSSMTTAINKKGSIPKEGDLIALAHELECSVMDFFADEEDIVRVQPRDEDEEDILRVYRNLSRRAKHEFMSMVYEYESKEELQGDNEETSELRENSAV